MKETKIKIPNWVMVIATLILAVGLTTTFVKASGRFNLPLSWILTPSGVSVDTDNNGIIDNVDAGVPSGMIAIFDTDCPSGWTRVSALDGKFLMASSTYNESAGGSDSIALVEANLPSHTHGAGTLLADTAGNHNHSYTHAHMYGNISGADICCKVDRMDSANTSDAGAHTHDISGSTGATGSGTAFDNRPAFATIVVCKKD